MANELADEGLAHFDICMQALKKHKGSLKKTRAALQRAMKKPILMEDYVFE